MNKTVGVIDLPELAEALRGAGVTVITGEDFRSSAIAIRDAISGGSGAFPVLVSDEKVPTKHAWTNRISGDTAVYLVQTNSGDSITCNGAREVVTPIPASELITMVGLERFASGLESILVEADGSVTGSAYVSTPDAHIDTDSELGGFSNFDDELMELLEDNSGGPFDISTEPVDPTQPQEDDDDQPLDILAKINPAVSSAPVRQSPQSALNRNMNANTKPQRAYDPWLDDEPAEKVDLLRNKPTFDEPTFTEPVQQRPVARPEPAQRPAAPVQRPVAQQPVQERPVARQRPVVREENDVNPFAHLEESKQTESPKADAYDFGNEYNFDHKENAVVDDFPLPAYAESANSNSDSPFSFDREEVVVEEPVAVEEPKTQNRRVASSDNPFEKEEVATPVDDDDDDDYFIPAQIVKTDRSVQPRKVQPEPVAVTPEPVAVQPEPAFMQQTVTHTETSSDYDIFEETPEEEPEEETYYYEQPQVTLSNQVVKPAGSAPVLFVWGAKGGVGKTTMAIAAAQQASRAGLKVVLIDGNRGQGDIRRYLKLTGQKLPSVYDVAIGHDPVASILSPRKLNEMRGKDQAKIPFALVAAPLSRVADPAVVTGWIYNRLINTARDHADLVIVDTQTFELFDTSGLIDSMVLPALVEDSWSLAVTDLNVTGTSNLRDQLENFSDKGTDKDRTLVLINRATNPDSVDREKLGKYFGDHATYLGSVESDNEIADAMNHGKLPELEESALSLIDKALYKITGNEKFVPATATETKTSRTKMFGRGRK